MGKHKRDAVGSGRYVDDNVVGVVVWESSYAPHTLMFVWKSSWGRASNNHQRCRDYRGIEARADVPVVRGWASSAVFVNPAERCHQHGE